MNSFASFLSMVPKISFELSLVIDMPTCCTLFTRTLVLFSDTNVCLSYEKCLVQPSVPTPVKTEPTP